MSRDDARPRSVRPEIDYLVVGHITQDLTPEGYVPGGTAAFASLTSLALGARPGIVTSVSAGAVLGPLAELPLAIEPTERSTVFENQYTESGRIQRVISVASALGSSSVPRDWAAPRVLHLGPVADEVEPRIAAEPRFAGSFVGATPQGWMRRWDAEGRVSPRGWSFPESLTDALDAVVLSREDLGNDEGTILDLADRFPVLVVTQGPQSVRLFVHGAREIEIPVRPRRERDPTGAGDVFAASFFWLVSGGMDLVEAAGVACDIAGDSVERIGIRGVPDRDDRALGSPS